MQSPGRGYTWGIKWVMEGPGPCRLSSPKWERRNDQPYGRLSSAPRTYSLRSGKVIDSHSPVAEGGRAVIKSDTPQE